MLFKLQCYGIGGFTLDWIRAFLNNRSQKVRVGSSLSTPVAVTSGVPQGSVLGPLLFLLFVNDISDLTNNSSCVKIKLFADDVKLYAAVTNRSNCIEIQHCLDRIFNWCIAWQLNLAPLKCVVLSIGHNTFDHTYFINNIPVKHVSSYDDLGIMTCSSLSHESHINSICTKANQRSMLLFKTFSSRDPTLLFRAFSTFVRPTLEYASSVWSPSQHYLISKLESVQQRFTQRLAGLSHLPYPERLAFLGADSLQTRRLKSDLTMYFKIIHNFCEMDCSNMFKFSGVASITRGHSFKMIKPVCKSNL